MSDSPSYNPRHTPPLLIYLVSILVFFTAAALFFKFIGPIPLSINQVSTQKQATFDVSGEGTASVVPDQAEINLGLTVTRSTVAPAQEETNKVINSIIQALKQNGVEESNITTQNYSVNPQYDYGSGGNRITGYTVSASLLVKLTDFTKLEQAIDSAVSLGANQVGGVTFTLSDKAKEKAETEARNQAVAKAKAKAQSLSQAAGVRLGRIVNVQENSFEPPVPIFRAMEVTAVKDGSPEEPTQIEPGLSEVKLTVTLSYETL